MNAFESFDLTGKKAVVTGGSRGMGREISLGLARAGAEVMVVSRRLESCAAVVDEIRAETGRAAFAHNCHVGKWDELDKLVEAAYDTLGTVDILINNAGMSPPYGEITEMPEALYDKVLDVNLKGPFRLTSLVGSRMADASGGGSIIFVSSVEAVTPGQDAIPYAAAKAGVNNLTTSFAHLFGPAVRVNCIQPGAFLTDISEHWDMQAFSEWSQSFALRRAAKPEEIVGTALYLASSASSYTTGAVLRVDGGYP